MIQILRAGGRTDGSTREVVEEVLADLKIKMGFITVHQKWGKKRGDKLQNFLPLESFPQFQFRELRILLRGSNNCLGHTYFYPIGFPLQFSHISFKFFLFTNSFANSCLHFSHIQYQVDFHFFCNLSLNFCNSAQNSWPIQTLLRSTDRKQKSICSQTLAKRKYQVRNSSSIFDSQALILAERNLKFWRPGWKHKYWRWKKIRLEWTGLGNDSSCMAWSALLVPQVV